MCWSFEVSLSFAAAQAAWRRVWGEGVSGGLPGLLQTTVAWDKNPRFLGESWSVRGPGEAIALQGRMHVLGCFQRAEVTGNWQLAK